MYEDEKRRLELEIMEYEARLQKLKQIKVDIINKNWDTNNLYHFPTSPLKQGTSPLERFFWDLLYLL